MAEPSERYKDLEFLISRIGMPAVMCAFVCYMLWKVVGDFRADMAWKLERSIRNERAIMQQLKIPVILDGERTEGK